MPFLMCFCFHCFHISTLLQLVIGCNRVLLDSLTLRYIYIYHYISLVSMRFDVPESYDQVHELARTSCTIFYIPWPCSSEPGRLGWDLQRASPCLAMKPLDGWNILEYVGMILWRWRWLYDKRWQTDERPTVVLCRSEAPRKKHQLASTLWCSVRK